MNIDKDVLFGLVMDGIRREAYSGVSDVGLCDYLVRLIVYLNPLDDAFFKSPPSAWDGLPADKSLKNTDGTRGLPIGNLTSQLFGNVYLNPLDQYVKRVLKIRCYGRYVDDMVLVHSDKRVLLDAVGKIRAFLEERLRLILHPKKISLQPASYGFNFLGVYILPYRVYPGRRLLRNCSAALLRHPDSFPEHRKRLVSYRGMFTHLNGRPKWLE